MLSRCGGGTGREYRDRYRSLSFNLTDPGNLDLRGAILAVRRPCVANRPPCAFSSWLLERHFLALQGILSPDQVADMSEEQLASKDKRAQFEQLQNEVRGEQAGMWRCLCHSRGPRRASAM